jgi:hypothetical protein
MQRLSLWWSMVSSIDRKEGYPMKQERGVRVSCPACEIDYRLRDAELLPIARCGRCYGAVVAERALADPVFVPVTPKTKAA